MSSYYRVAVTVLHYYEIDAPSPYQAEVFAEANWQTLPCLNTEVVEALVIDGDLSSDTIEEE